jgi:putative transposase
VCKTVKILGATVSCEAGHWYVSIQVEIKQPLPPPPTSVVGVDVGLKTAAVVSDGRRRENQKPLAFHLKKLGKLQRKLSRKQKTKDPETGQTIFSKNYQKQRLKVARKHQQIANIRRDIQHKFTTELARTCGAIGIEDLNILGMMANRSLARAVADAAMGQLLQFLKKQCSLVKGFRTGDLVRAVVKAGEKMGSYQGRVAVRASGFFNITTHQVTIQGISHRWCRLLQQRDGYQYHQRKETSSPFVP